jgi:hypothetical protein
LRDAVRQSLNAKNKSLTFRVGIFITHLRTNILYHTNEKKIYTIRRRYTRLKGKPKYPEAVKYLCNTKKWYDIGIPNQDLVKDFKLELIMNKIRQEVEDDNKEETSILYLESLLNNLESFKVEIKIENVSNLNEKATLELRRS